MANPVTPDGVDTTDEYDDESMRQAATTLAAAITDPAFVAQQNAELRAAVTGAYALLHAFVKRNGGDVTIKAAERIVPPIEHLRTELDPKTGDVRLVIDTKGRRKARRY